MGFQQNGVVFMQDMQDYFEEIKEKLKERLAEDNNLSCYARYTKNKYLKEALEIVEDVEEKYRNRHFI